MFSCVTYIFVICMCVCVFVIHSNLFNFMYINLIHYVVILNRLQDPIP